MNIFFINFKKILCKTIHTFSGSISNEFRTWDFNSASFVQAPNEYEFILKVEKDVRKAYSRLTITLTVDPPPGVSIE